MNNIVVPIRDGIVRSQTLESGSSGGAGGGGNGMLERIVRLEGMVELVGQRLGQIDHRIDRLDVRLDGLDGRLRSVETGLSTLTERVAHLPSKGYIFTTAIAIITLLTAVFLYADKLKMMLGV